MIYIIGLSQPKYTPVEIATYLKPNIIGKYGVIDETGSPVL